MSRFVRLCETPSPTGEERAVADMVTAELRSFGVKVVEDDAADVARAGAGNLLGRIPGRSDRYLMFCAHLDTVPHDEPIRVELDDQGIYRSVGDTILGADNKAAVAVLLELAARCAAEPPPVGVELLFTVAEEQGLRGAAAFDASTLEAEVGYVLDHASAIGEVITAAPTHMRIEAEITVVEAHAGIRPEEGRSAIVAAATAVAAMELGRLDEETTANVGLIEGGTSGNVVPGRCRLVGEARSLDPDRATQVIAAISDQIMWAASEAGCEASVVTDRVFPGYRIPERSEALRIAESALRTRGYDPVRIPTGGGSDANVLIAEGIDCLLLANGTWENHTPAEWVARDDMVAMLGVCEAILSEAGR